VSDDLFVYLCVRIITLFSSLIINAFPLARTCLCTQRWAFQVVILMIEEIDGTLLRTSAGIYQHALVGTYLGKEGTYKLETYYD
jgi:hypothetical protein